MQVQTESTNLAVVKETVLGSRTPPTTGWRNLDPHSYGKLGASYATTRRDPISRAQQLRRGMTTDEDSGIAIEADVTKDMIDRFAEGIYRCQPKHAGNTGQSLFEVTAVTSTGFTVAADGDLTQRFLIYARGLATTANNGLKMVGAASIGTEIKTSGLVAEASPPANATVDVVGRRGASGDIEFDTDGNLICTADDFTTWGLTEEQALFFGGTESANRFETEEYNGAAFIDTIAAKKLTLKRRSWLVEGKAELDLAETTSNLDSVLQAILSGPDGDDITVAFVADGTPAVKAELDMDAAGNSAHMNTIVRAKVAGTAGNLITVEMISGAPTAAGVLTEIGTHVKIQFKATATASTVADIETLIGTSTLIEVKTAGTGGTSLDATDVFDSVPLAGGTNATAPSVSEAGDAVTVHFTPGTSTLAQIEAVIDSDSTLIEVKTPGTGATVAQSPGDVFSATNLEGGSDGIDDGDGKEIDVYFSRFYRVVSNDHDDYLTPSYAFEMEYPGLADDGTSEYWYLLGNMIDEWTWNIPLTTKATVNATFVGTHTLPLTSSRKTGPSTAKNPNANAGISTATDLFRVRIMGLDELGISTDMQSAKLMIKNNVTAQKQLAQLGATKMNQGQHVETLEATVIFTSREIIEAVRNNRESVFDVLMHNSDFGAMLNVEAMTLDASDPNFERQKSVLINSKATGHQNDLSGSTGSMSVFGYIPNLDEDE